MPSVHQEEAEVRHRRRPGRAPAPRSQPAASAVPYTSMPVASMEGRASLGRDSRRARQSRTEPAGPGHERERPRETAEEGRPLQGEHPFVEVGRRRFSLHQQRAAVSGEQLPRVVRRRRTGRALRARVVARSSRSGISPAPRPPSRPETARPGRYGRSRDPVPWRARDRAGRRRWPPKPRASGRPPPARCPRRAALLPAGPGPSTRARRRQTVSGPGPGVRAPLIGVDQHVQVEEGALGRPAARTVGPEVVHDQEPVVGERSRGRLEDARTTRPRRTRARCSTGRSRPNPRHPRRGRAEVRSGGPSPRRSGERPVVPEGSCAPGPDRRAPPPPLRAYRRPPHPRPGYRRTNSAATAPAPPARSSTKRPPAGIGSRSVAPGPR